MSADVADSGAADVTEKEIPACRHWRRGGCLYGDKCRFAHPPDALGEKNCGGNGSANGTHVEGTDTPQTPVRNNRRVKKKGRCGHLRRFLVDTFGAEVLREGYILDVGGGKGELAFELENLNGARCVVVDTAPLRIQKFKKKMNAGWYDKSQVFAKYNTAVGGERSAIDTTDEAVSSPSADDEKAKTEKTEGQIFAAKTPTHLRVLWYPNLWVVTSEYKDDVTPYITPSDVVTTSEELLTPDLKQKHEIAVYEAWAMAKSVSSFPKRGGEKKNIKSQGKNGDHDNDSATITNVFQSSLRLRERSAQSTSGTAKVGADAQATSVKNSYLDASEDMIASPKEDATPKTQTSSFLAESKCDCLDPQCGTLPPDAADVRHYLRDCILLLGMHSDQATEWIVDFALRYRVRFAVVPCCVCPTLFPKRVNNDGTQVRTSIEFIEYLQRKAPRGEIKVDTLPFEGKNTVVYSNFDVDLGRGYRG